MTGPTVPLNPVPVADQDRLRDRVRDQMQGCADRTRDRDRDRLRDRVRDQICPREGDKNRKQWHLQHQSRYGQG